MTFLDSLVNSGISYGANVDTSKLSTIKAGGCADYVLYPKTESELIEAIRICKNYGERPLVVGNMSNMLICDSGYQGALVSTRRMNGVSFETDGCIYALSGVMLPRLIRSSALRDICISPQLSGIPTTLGGAVRGNAGAYGVSISDILIGIKVYFPKEDKTVIMRPEDADFGYRTSIFKKEESVILGAYLAYDSVNSDDVIQEISHYAAVRRKSQPQEPSLGSFFKNPDGLHSASYLIDRAGLKGASVAGATVSEKHAGFIINRGCASASDISKLSTLVRSSVFNYCGVMLEYEAELIGKFL